MIADVQIEKQWNFDTYSQKLDNAISIASGLREPDKLENKGIGQENINSHRFVLVEENDRWKISSLIKLDKREKTSNSLGNYGYQIKKIDGYTIYLRYNAIQMIFASLNKHKGNLMSVDSRGTFIKLMSEFNNLPVLSAYSAYSTINKIVKTRLKINDYLALNITYFEDSSSDELAFSIECDKEFVLAGSGKPSDLSRKFAQLINDLNDERIS